MRLFIALLSLAAAASAHFTLDYPTTRGFDEDIETQFCGGFNSTGTRVPFPLSNGPVVIDSHHASASVAIAISFDQDPTTFAQFNTTPNGQTYGLLKPYGTINGAGIFCWQTDVNALGLSGVTNGTNATIQVLFNGPDGTLLQCSDVTLSSTFVANATCQNATEAAASSTSSPSATGSAASAVSGAPAATTSSKNNSARIGATPSAGAAIAIVLGLVALVA